jgi:hypothetical protein
VLTSLTAPLLYWLCLLLFERRSIALMAGAAWALLPTTGRLAGLLLGEPLSGLCLIAGLVTTIYAGRRGSALLAAVAGLLFGFAVLTRVYLLLALAGPAIWLSAQRWRRESAIVLCAALLVLGAWAARNAARLGTFTLSTQTANMWLGNNAWTRGSWYADWTPQLAHLRAKYPEFDALDEAGQSRVYAREAFSDVTRHPGRIAWLMPRKVIIGFSPASWMGFDWLYALLLPCMFIGCCRLAADAKRRHVLWLIGMPIFAIVATTLVTFGDARFRYPVDGLLMVLAAVGCLEVLWPLVAARLAPSRARGIA